jgi:hypothetical protein
VKKTRRAHQQINYLAGGFHEVSLISPDALNVDGEQSMYALLSKFISNGHTMELKFFYLDADSKEHINEYLAGLGMAEVGNSNELVRFNEDHSAKELPQGAAQSTILWLK